MAFTNRSNPYANGVTSVGGGQRGASTMGQRTGSGMGGGGMMSPVNVNSMDELYRVLSMGGPANQSYGLYGNQGGPLSQILPTYLQTQAQMAQSNAARDVGLAQAGSQRDVGMASAGSSRDVGLAGAGSQRDVGLASANATIQAAQAAAEAQRALAQAQLDAAVRTATINTGSAEKISAGRNDALLAALSGWGNTMGGIFGGLGNSFGQALGGGLANGNRSTIQPPTFEDPYKKYVASVNPSQMIAQLRGMA